MHNFLSQNLQIKKVSGENSELESLKRIKTNSKNSDKKKNQENRGVICDAETY